MIHSARILLMLASVMTGTCILVVAIWICKLLREPANRASGRHMYWLMMSYMLLVLLSGSTIMWDLLTPEQYPLWLRICITVPALVIGARHIFPILGSMIAHGRFR